MVHVLVTYWRIVTGHARVHIENQRVGSHRKSFSMYGHSTFRWMVHLSNLLSEMLAHLGYGVAEDKPEPSIIQAAQANSMKHPKELVYLELQNGRQTKN